MLSPSPSSTISLAAAGLHKVTIETWGCQMNVADSERMLALLANSGVQATNNAGTADIVVLNTCNIREKARHKVMSRLGELRRAKELNPKLVLVVTGCVAQMEAAELAAELPFVDLLIGPDQIEKLPELLQKVVEKRGSQSPLVQAEFDSLPEYSIPQEAADPWFDSRTEAASRFVNIIKGCNNFCTYCVVPHSRGREKSRPVAEIIAEVQFYVERGVREIVLLGQNVNSYGRDPSPPHAQQQEPFLNLLERVAEVPGVRRLRFVTSNPHDFPAGMPNLFSKIPVLCEQLHLPVQSGSNQILRAMNRRYTRERYLEIVTAMRAARPEIALSTDLIVGFPGETNEDFEATLSLVTEARFASAFAFKYSPRKGTPAANFPNQIAESIKEKRLQQLLALLREETTRQNLAEIGRKREVLVSYRTKNNDGSWFGRTSAGRLVRILSANCAPGELREVEITTATFTALEGIIL